MASLQDDLPTAIDYDDKPGYFLLKKVRAPGSGAWPVRAGGFHTRILSGAE